MTMKKKTDKEYSQFCGILGDLWRYFLQATTGAVHRSASAHTLLRALSVYHTRSRIDGAMNFRTWKWRQIVYTTAMVFSINIVN
jgi:hypothetical protein